jgi:hypothetical protein
MQQGVTFLLQVNVVDFNNQPIDLTGFSAKMEIRSNYSNNTIAESLSTANGEISIPLSGNGNNQMYFTLPANRTANVYVNLTNPGNPPKSIYVYDVSLTAANTVTTKILYGNINFYGQVTR